MTSIEPARSNRGATIAVLLTLTALMIGLSLYYGLRDQTPPPPADRKDTLVQDVMRNMRNLIDLRSPAQAISLGHAYVRAHPGDVQVRPLLAEALHLKGDLAGAEAVADALLKIAPHHPQGLLLKGRLVHSRGGSEYLDYFRRAAASPENPSNEILREAGCELLAAQQFDEAKPLLERAHDNGLSDAATLGGLGQLAMREKNWPTAGELLQQAVQAEPTEPKYALLLAQVLVRQNIPQSAAGVLRRSLTTCRKRDELWMQLGRILESLGPDQDAAQAYSEAAHYSQHAVSASQRAAALYLKLGQYALAMKYADQAAQAGASGDEFELLMRQIEDARFGRGGNQ